MAVLRQLKDFYWKERWFLFASLFFLTLATGLGVVYPNLLRYLIDEVILKEQYELVPMLALGVVGVILIKASFQFVSAFLGSRLANRVAYNLRNALYEKLQYLSYSYYDKARTGDLMSRLTGDLEGIRQFVGWGFSHICNVFLMISFGAAVMFWVDWKLTLVTLACMPVLGFTAIRFERQITPAFRTIRLAMSHLTTAVQENINGVRTVKSFAREPYEIDKFTKVSDEYRNAHIDMAGKWAAFFPTMEFLSSASVVILLTVGGLFVINGSLTLGELVAFFSLIWYIINPLRDIGFHINNYTQSKASGERVLEVLNQKIHVKDNDHAVEVSSDLVKGHVRFENVTFAYPDKQPALSDFNLNAPAGSVIGILGGTGSGKTTVIQLLQRAYNVKHGRITLDGMNIQEITVKSLRRQISFVFQETFLFSASILNNIAYARRDASMEEIIRASKLAKAHDFIMELPEGYNTIVGERGLGLSGGQKQRIAIARAILKDPKILVLDDATSAVDMETEHEIQSGLREVMEGRTTFVIAHRISSLKNADEIIVLEGGRIVQRGKHEQLLQQQGPYLETYKIQYSDHPKLNEVIRERKVSL
jgi:ATP-binding cassette, subfamily B, multidrug efflux pump